MSDKNNMFNKNGVINGTYYCNIKEDNILNDRLFARNVPTTPLPPQFSMRPASTKYSIMPIVDPRSTEQLEPIKQYPTYNSATMFNPGNAMSPWSGFATNIDVYSRLRNQGQALQHCEQRDYIPSSSSDLYESIIPVEQNIQSHPLLFKEEKFAPSNKAIYKMGDQVFGNHTRQDLKNVTTLCPDNKLQ